MATNATPNFGLNQWEADDPVLREDFNADNQKLEQALIQLGNCHIAAGSYVGTGQFGVDHPNRLELGFKPLVLFLNTSSGLGNNAHVVWFAPSEHPTHTNTVYVTYQVNWEDTGVSWYMITQNANHKDPVHQFNTEGVTYTYTALGYKV